MWVLAASTRLGPYEIVTPLGAGGMGEVYRGRDTRLGREVAVFAALGVADQAFEWLKKACDERTPFVIWVKVDPTLDNLHSDPRFTKVLKDMGLPP
jgi:hypothetical protein